MAGRPINESRVLAILLGDKTYIGAPHWRCETTERYVTGGGCVHCARVIATENREMLRVLKHDASVAEADRRVIEDTYKDDVNHGPVEELDGLDPVVPEMVEEPISAADRFRRDIDNLM